MKRLPVSKMHSLKVWKFKFSDSQISLKTLLLTLQRCLGSFLLQSLSFGVKS